MIVRKYDNMFSVKLYCVTRYQSITANQIIMKSVLRSLFSFILSPLESGDEPFAYIYYHPDDSKFSKDDVLNNVCEFRRVDLNTEEHKWDLMRVRTDRKMELDRGNYFGNGFYIAEYTWQNYQNPLRFEDLIISNFLTISHR